MKNLEQRIQKIESRYGMSDDRTFCSNKKCKYIECELNQNNIRDTWKNRSVTDYENTEYCKKVGVK
jgi:hypothetical protein